MAIEKQRRTFISYSRVNKEFAVKLAKELRSDGYSIWLDQLDIPTGSRWDDELEKALEECEIFMLILTPASASSDNVKDEIGYAIDNQKRILPILLENCNIPIRLRRFQYIDFTTKSYDEGFESAKQLLTNFINETTIPRIDNPVVSQNQKTQTNAERDAKAEAERLTKQKAEDKRLAQGKVESERKAKQEFDRLAIQKAEADRKAKAEEEYLTKQKAEEERLKQVKAATERKAKQESENRAIQKAETDRLPVAVVGGLISIFVCALVVFTGFFIPRIFDIIPTHTPTHTPTRIPTRTPTNTLQTTIGDEPEFPVTSDAFNVVTAPDMVTFQTKLSSDDVLKFYRDEFSSQGYEEDASMANTFGKTFTLAFTGHESGKVIYVVGADAGDGSLYVTITLG